MKKSRQVKRKSSLSFRRQTLAHMVRQHVLNEATFYTWKIKYVGLPVSELTWLKYLESESQRLKKRYVERGFNHTIKEVLRKK